jgi:hypothetical protein
LAVTPGRRRAEVSVGRNPIGGSLCSAEFSGEILRAERIPSERE